MAKRPPARLFSLPPERPIDTQMKFSPSCGSIIHTLSGGPVFTIDQTAVTTEISIGLRETLSHVGSSFCHVETWRWGRNCCRGSLSSTGWRMFPAVTVHRSGIRREAARCGGAGRADRWPAPDPSSASIQLALYLEDGHRALLPHTFHN